MKIGAQTANGVTVPKWTATDFIRTYEPATSTSGNANQSYIKPPVGQVLTVTMIVVDPGEALKYFESALNEGFLVSGCKVIAVGVKNPFVEIERLREKVNLAIDVLTNGEA